MENNLGVALFGYGYAGKTFHAPLVRSTQGLELASVLTGRPEAVSSELPMCKPIARPDEAFEDDAISLIVIATPNESHAPLTEAALRAGKHVVVDKPFTLTLDQARALRQLADDRGLILSVFQNRRWDSDFLALQALLHAGRLGRLVHLESRFDRFRPQVRNRWREKAMAGSGIWFDLGPHLIDQALVLFGLPERVSGIVAGLRDDAAADDWCQAFLDYGNLQVTLSASMLVSGGMPRYAAHGTAASWVKHGLDVQETQLIEGMMPGAVGWGLDSGENHLFESGAESGAIALLTGDYPAYYLGIRDAMMGVGKNPVTPAQAVATMAVLETVAHAARTKAWLPLPLTDEECDAFARS